MYNLKFTLSPADIYLDNYNGQKAARINGKVWMRYNLGADNSINPDQDPIVSGLHGGYYQFGRSTSVANGTETSLNSNFNGNPAAANAWNSGTEAAPVKTGNDPCPQNYRIPTRTELQSLLDGTTKSEIGTFSDSPTNFSAAKVYTSNRNSSVKLTFPAIGARNAAGGRVNNRGISPHVCTSTASDASNAYANGRNAIVIHPKNTGNSIRCIAI